MATKIYNFTDSNYKCVFDSEPYEFEPGVANVMEDKVAKWFALHPEHSKAICLASELKARRATWEADQGFNKTLTEVAPVGKDPYQMSKGELLHMLRVEKGISRATNRMTIEDLLQVGREEGAILDAVPVFKG